MIKDVKTFCEMFYESTMIPCSYHDMKSEENFFFPSVYMIDDYSREILDGFFNFSKNPDYFVSDSFSYYGFVASEASQAIIIIGPVFSTPVTDVTIRSFMHELAILPEHKETVTDFLNSIPLMSYYKFLNTLTYVYFCLNDIKISAAEHFRLEDTSSIQQISSAHTEALFDLKENQRHHNTYNYERKLMQFVREGETEKVKGMLSEGSQLNEGIIADNALRQEKNIFITLATSVSRSAILGGMDVEQSLQLSDIYIQESEKSQNVRQISSLSYSMLIDYTQRVAEHKIPGGMSQEVFDCVQFITRHVNEPIQVSDVANHVGRSRSYLTGKFKNELGFDISSFIMRCKLEEAKSLLTTSDKSLSEISYYLCFSTQAYFQNVFKKKFGLTPAQYRNKTKRIK